MNSDYVCWINVLNLLELWCFIVFQCIHYCLFEIQISFVLVWSSNGDIWQYIHSGIFYKVLYYHLCTFMFTVHDQFNYTTHTSPTLKSVLFVMWKLRLIRTRSICTSLHKYLSQFDSSKLFLMKICDKKDYRTEKNSPYQYGVWTCKSWALQIWHFLQKSWQKYWKNYEHNCIDYYIRRLENLFYGSEQKLGTKFLLICFMFI